MKRFHYFEISSTNDYAKEHLKSHNNVVVTADFQSFGRGRNNKIWEGTPGENVYFSYGIKHKPPLNFTDAAVYQALGALAVLNVLENTAPEAVFKLKYPNDVYAKTEGGYKKISGILVEHSFVGDSCFNTILGVGINVLQKKFPPELEQKAVSLKQLGVDAVIDRIYNLLIEQIFELEQEYKSSILNLWIEKLNIKGKSILVRGKDGDWVVKDVLEDCRLLLENPKNNDKLVVDNGDSVIYDLE
jgi:BirA family biotin operon repressor/biotin-[acetyl-CoA-carboxylase] ligase